MNLKDIIPFKEYFNPIYGVNGDEINPIPEDMKVTAYCVHRDGTKFYLIDQTEAEMGFDSLLAQSWIEQERLEYLIQHERL